MSEAKTNELDPTGVFSIWDCPGAEMCKEPRRESMCASPHLYPCATCKAPRRHVLTDGTIVYRSYADYCD